MTPIACSTRAHFRLGAVFHPLDLIDNAAVAVAAIGEIAGFGRMLPDHRALTAVGLIIQYPGLLPMQQLGQLTGIALAVATISLALKASASIMQSIL
jgi:hypothetical protein